MHTGLSVPKADNQTILNWKYDIENASVLYGTRMGDLKIRLITTRMVTEDRQDWLTKNDLWDVLDSYRGNHVGDGGK